MNKIQFLSAKLSDDICLNKRLYDPYNIHKMIWELWGHKEKTPYLFRFENKNLFILFNEPIENQVKWIEGARISNEKEVNFSGKYQYNIIVNPSVRDIKTGKRRSICRTEEIIEWWKKLAQKNGVRIDRQNTIVTNKNYIKSIKKNISFFKAKISGIIEITDTDIFNKNFSKGFGRQKRMGCGLMLITKKIN